MYDEPPLDSLSAALDLLDDALAELLAAVRQGSAPLSEIRARLLATGVTPAKVGRCFRALAVLLRNHDPGIEKCCFCLNTTSRSGLVFGSKATICLACALAISAGAVTVATGDERCGFCAASAADELVYASQAMDAFVCDACVDLAMDIFTDRN
jgi:PIN domain nuclease of toxin-antitoxin system